MVNIKYTQEEENYIREHYPTTPTTNVAKHLGKSVSSVYSKANTMGVHKSPEYMASGEFTGVIKVGHAIGVEFRFKKGRTSDNKGCKTPADV